MESQWLLENEIYIRLGCFFGVFILMAIWERARPKRQLLVNKTSRWLHNIALVILNSWLLRLVFPTAAVGMAAFTQQQGWGLLTHFAVPATVAFILSLLVLDLVIYLQHVMMHAVPLLWRLHRVHHVDQDIDVTTGLRFHPIEIIVSMLIKFAAIILIGPSLAAVIVFEVLLNATAMFNHSNIRLPERFDRILRWLLVTPDMHRVHHSQIEQEANSNYGFNLPWWDRLFDTYQAQPVKGHDGMMIGVESYDDEQLTQKLSGMLKLPFLPLGNGYTVNRRKWK